MDAQEKLTISTEQVLGKALQNAAKSLALSQNEIATIIGKDRSVISRAKISPTSKTGELALLFIRCYQGLYSLLGGDQKQMQHWLHTENHHIGGIPLQKMHSTQGLVHVLDYLDAMRSRA